MGGASGGCIWDGLPAPECGEIDTADLPADLSIPKIPEYNWPDIILEGKKGGFPVDIKAIYNVGGNYLSQGSDIHKNIRAFKKVELSVCHEQFMTPTARYCDVILPASSFLEREDILFSGMNYLFYSGKTIEPPDNVKDDYDIFCELSNRLDFEDKYSEGKSSAQWINQFLAESEITDPERFKQTGHSLQNHCHSHGFFTAYISLDGQTGNKRCGFCTTIQISQFFYYCSFGAANLFCPGRGFRLVIICSENIFFYSIKPDAVSVEI